MSEQRPAEPATAVVTEHDLADTACFLDGHDKPSNRCHCTGCEDWAASAFAAIIARHPEAEAAAAPYIEALRELVEWWDSGEPGKLRYGAKGSFDKARSLLQADQVPAAEPRR